MEEARTIADQKIEAGPDTALESVVEDTVDFVVDTYGR